MQQTSNYLLQLPEPSDYVDPIPFNNNTITVDSELKKAEDHRLDGGKHKQAEGVTQSGTNANAEGNGTTASGDYSHAEGESTSSVGRASHAEGRGTLASGYYSHAEGYYTEATGEGSHAEGKSSDATGVASHVEGVFSKAIGEASHAQGERSEAHGFASHAEGSYSYSFGNLSHAQGKGVKTRGYGQTAIGAYNVEQGTENSKVDTDHVFIVGNGTGTSGLDRSNALALTWKGTLTVAEEVQTDDGHKLTEKIGKTTASISVLATDWVGTSAPYTCSKTVSGIASTDAPHITLDYGASNNATSIALRDEYSKIDKAVSSTNTLTFTCFEEKPAENLTLQVEVYH